MVLLVEHPLFPALARTVRGGCAQSVPDAWRQPSRDKFDEQSQSRISLLDDFPLPFSISLAFFAFPVPNSHRPGLVPDRPSLLRYLDLTRPSIGPSDSVRPALSAPSPLPPPPFLTASLSRQYFESLQPPRTTRRNDWTPPSLTTCRHTSHSLVSTLKPHTAPQVGLLGKAANPSDALQRAPVSISQGHSRLFDRHGPCPSFSSSDKCCSITFLGGRAVTSSPAPLLLIYIPPFPFPSEGCFHQQTKHAPRRHGGACCQRCHFCVPGSLSRGEVGHGWRSAKRQATTKSFFDHGRLYDDKRKRNQTRNRSSQLPKTQPGRGLGFTPSRHSRLGRRV